MPTCATFDLCTQASATSGDILAVGPSCRAAERSRPVSGYQDATTKLFEWSMLGYRMEFLPVFWYSDQVQVALAGPSIRTRTLIVRAV